MPPEVQAAIVGLIVGLIAAIAGTAIALIRFVPTYVQNRVAAAMEAQKEERERRNKELQAEIDQSKVMGETLKSQNENISTLVKQLGSLIGTQDKMAESIHANANALTMNSEAIGGMGDALDVLIREGSVPLRKLIEDVGAIREEVEKQPGRHTELLKHVQQLQVDLAKILTPIPSASADNNNRM